MSAAAPSVLLVEDHATMGRMLARFLREWGKMEVWAVVETAEAALAKMAERPASASQPDVALVDVSLPGMSGLDLVVELARLYPRLCCVMVSAHGNPGYVRKALANGARGYVTKGDPPVIVEAVRCVLTGELYLSADVEQALSG